LNSFHPLADHHGNFGFGMKDDCKMTDWFFCSSVGDLNLQFGRLQKQRSVVSVIEELPSAKSKVLLDDDIPNTCSDPSSVTNNCLRQLYKTDGYQVKAPQSNMIGVTGYLEEVGSLKDAQMFLKTQRRDQVGGKFEVVKVNNGKDDQELDQDQIDRQLGVEVNYSPRSQLFDRSRLY
jgi:tripeptidyl-peptidase-1